MKILTVPGQKRLPGVGKPQEHVDFRLFLKIKFVWGLVPWICQSDVWICQSGAWNCQLGAWNCLLGAWNSLLGAWICQLGARSAARQTPRLMLTR